MPKIVEIWKDVPGYEGFYQVSSFGNVKGLHRIVDMKNGKVKTIHERTLRFNYDLDGYQSVQLCKNSAPKRFKVHRLVCLVFNGDSIIDKATVNHKDGNKINNHFENLEWVTLRDNIKHGFDTGLIKKKTSILTEKQVQDIFSDLRSQHEIAKDYGVSQGTISNCKQGKIKSYTTCHPSTVK